MPSNTTLDSYDKKRLKRMRQEHKGFTVNNEEVTVAYALNGGCVEFSTAICSGDETRFREEVGEFIAIDRFNSGSTVKLPKEDFICFLQDTLSIYPEFNF